MKGIVALVVMNKLVKDLERHKSTRGNSDDITKIWFFLGGICGVNLYFHINISSNENASASLVCLLKWNLLSHWILRSFTFRSSNFKCLKLDNIQVELLLMAISRSRAWAGCSIVFRKAPLALTAS